jgi:hypothetical protein
VGIALPAGHVRRGRGGGPDGSGPGWIDELLRAAPADHRWLRAVCVAVVDMNEDGIGAVHLASGRHGQSPPVSALLSGALLNCARILLTRSTLPRGSCDLEEMLLLDSRRSGYRPRS